MAKPFHSRRINLQIDWMVTHGLTIAGYVERYGDSNHFPACVGVGGQVIWLADFIHLMNCVRDAATGGARSSVVNAIQEARVELALWHAYLGTGIKG